MIFLWRLQEPGVRVSQVVPDIDAEPRRVHLIALEGVDGVVSGISPKLRLQDFSRIPLFSGGDDNLVGPEIQPLAASIAEVAEINQRCPQGRNSQVGCSVQFVVKGAARPIQQVRGGEKLYSIGPCKG